MIRIRGKTKIKLYVENMLVVTRIISKITIVKCQAGFMTSSDREYNSPYEVFRSYKLKHLHSIAYVTKDGYAITVYARTGKKVWINSQILSEITVGDINQDLYNTSLYNQLQYQAVNAKSWASKAYVMNETNQEIITE